MMKKTLDARRLACRALLMLFPLLFVAFFLGERPRAADQVPPASTTQPAVTVMGGEVHGTIFALIFRPGGTLPPPKIDPTIFLPDISVYLEDVSAPTTIPIVTPVVTTDLDGAFVVPSQPQAVYRLCWKAAGYAPGCQFRSRSA